MAIRVQRKLRAITIGLAISTGLGGVTWLWVTRPERYLDAAEQAFQEREYDDASSWLDVPEGTPRTRQRALILRARIAVQGNDLRRAAKLLEQVEPEGPEGPEASDLAFLRGRLLLAAKQPMSAMAWFNESLKGRPDDADAHRWLAAAAYDLGDRSTTVRALLAVTRLDPRDSRPWRTLGLIFKENVDFERARDAFREALRLDKAQPAVRLELAETLLRLGDTAAAERELMLCRGHVAEDRRAELLAECLRARGDIDGSLRVIHEGLRVRADHPGLLAQRAQVDLAQGRAQEALDALNLAASADPYRAQTFYQRSLVRRRLDQRLEAERDAARAAELNQGIAELSKLNEQAEADPHDAEVRFQLGQTCVKLGNFELAGSWFRAALACDPNHAAARRALATSRVSKQPVLRMPPSREFNP